MLGGSSPEEDRQAVHQLIFLEEVAILRRLLHVTKRSKAARDDRHFVHGLGAGRQLGRELVALATGETLVISA